ncbi:MAG: hypothetical protein L3J69_00190 [Desulfobacula sp.]|nr:hypothetical protein [Desulfobacula sp.]
MKTANYSCLYYVYDTKTEKLSERTIEIDKRVVRLETLVEVAKLQQILYEPETGQGTTDSGHYEIKSNFLPEWARDLLLT